VDAPAAELDAKSTFRRCSRDRLDREEVGRDHGLRLRSQELAP
jgi:hypothetical protein